MLEFCVADGAPRCVVSHHQRADLPFVLCAADGFCGRQKPATVLSLHRLRRYDVVPLRGMSWPRWSWRGGQGIHFTDLHFRPEGSCMVPRSYSVDIWLSCLWGWGPFLPDVFVPISRWCECNENNICELSGADSHLINLRFSLSFKPTFCPFCLRGPQPSSWAWAPHLGWMI